MSLKSKDWLKLIGIIGAGMFAPAALGPLLGAEGAAVAGAAEGAGAAAAGASGGAGAGLTNAGMFAGPEAEALLGGIDAFQAAGHGGMGVAQQGIGPGSFSNQLTGAMQNPSSLLSSQGLPANLASRAAGNLGDPKSRAFMNAGFSMLAGPQQQQPPPMPRGGGGFTGHQGSLPVPYSRGGGGGGLDQLLQAAQRGDQQAVQKLKALLSQRGAG